MKMIPSAQAVSMSDAEMPRHQEFLRFLRHIEASVPKKSVNGRVCPNLRSLAPDAGHG